MVPTKDIIFGLTIFLTVSTLSLTVAVVVIALALRRLRKKVELEFFNKIKKVDRTCNPRKGNRYTPSKRDQSATDPESYESPPLTDAQRERLDQQREHQNAGTSSTTAAQKVRHTQKAESIEMKNRIPSDSYVEVLADDDLACFEEEEQYTEPIIPGNDPLASNLTPKPRIKPKSAVTQQQLPRKIQSPRVGIHTVTQQQASRHPKTMPRLPNNNEYPIKRQQMKQKDHSKQTASMGRPFAYVGVTQPHVSHNRKSHQQTFQTTNVTQHGFTRDTRQRSGNTNAAGQLQEEEYYLPMASNVNEVYEEDEFYENKEVIDSLKNTGRPEDEEEIYENKEIIAQNRAPSASHVTEEEFYVNCQNEASQVASEFEPQQMYENYEEEEIYQNESVFSNC